MEETLFKHVIVAMCREEVTLQVWKYFFFSSFKASVICQYRLVDITNVLVLAHTVKNGTITQIL